MKNTIFALFACLVMMPAAAAAQADGTATAKPWGQPMFYPYRSSSCGTYDGCREYETRGMWKRFDTERGYMPYRPYYSPYGQPGEPDPRRYDYRDDMPYRYPYSFNAYRFNYRPEQPIYPIYPFYR